MSRKIGCWCGNMELIFYSDQYLRCPECESLISKILFFKEDSHDAFRADELYGQKYWFSHQEEELKLPDIIHRARQDLTDRCLYWLNTLLKFRLPPARVLELGCAHGGFVAILRWAGYNAMGLEINPWTVDFARRTFQVPVLLGELENQRLIPSSLDAIVLMDVLEHLADPFTTIAHVLHLLKPDGIIMLQTPRYPEGKSYQEMVSQGDRFLEMLIEKEHLYLFSRRAIQEFFGRQGVEHLYFESALFTYDMFLIAGRTPLKSYTVIEVEENLSSRPRSRLVLALLDLNRQKQEILQKYQEAEADRAARLEIINRVQKQLLEIQAEKEHLQRQLNIAQSLVRRLKMNIFYRALPKIWFWGKLDQKISHILNPFPEKSFDDSLESKIEARIDSPSKISRVAVDLTPVLPGAENGGAKLLATELVRYLGRLLPQCQFVLLTAEKSHGELSFLDAPNVRRQMIRKESTFSFSSKSSPIWKRIRSITYEFLAHFLPEPVFRQVKAFYLAYLNRRLPTTGVTKQLGVDLLFCPFTAPFYYEPSIPTVSIIYDLQYLYYPQFFEREDYSARDRNFREACRLADRLICISNFVRESVLAHSNLSPEKVLAIPIRLCGRLKKPEPETISAVLQKYGLQERGFLLYPANFWPHKNHAMLIVAFGIFRSRHRESDIHLVCTGSPDRKMEEYQEIVYRMGLDKWIHFLGFLPEGDFAALLSSCRALIFPSLFEGFGMPVLEAMAWGKPVLCSNSTSLPEVGGDAAYYFDPKKPEDIVRAVETLLEDPELERTLIQKGLDRAIFYTKTEEMAKQYLQVFYQALVTEKESQFVLYGVYLDGWTGNSMTLRYGRSSKPRHLAITLFLPPAYPYQHMTLKILDNEKEQKNYRLKRGKSISLWYQLSLYGGLVRIQFHPLFQPKQFGINQDERWLGCQCLEAAVLYDSHRENLLDPNQSR